MGVQLACDHGASVCGEVAVRIACLLAEPLRQASGVVEVLDEWGPSGAVFEVSGEVREMPARRQCSFVQLSGMDCARARVG